MVYICLILGECLPFLFVEKFVSACFVSEDSNQNMKLHTYFLDCQLCPCLFVGMVDWSVVCRCAEKPVPYLAHKGQHDCNRAARCVQLLFYLIFKTEDVLMAVDLALLSLQTLKEFVQQSNRFS